MPDQPPFQLPEPPAPRDPHSFAAVAGGRFADLLSGWTDAEFLAHDFFRGGGGAPEGVAPEKVPVLRAYHRLLRMYPDAAVADTLYGLGYHSAHQVATVPAHRFVARHAQALGGPEAARAVHRAACAVRARVRLLRAAVADAGSPHFRATRFYNASTATVEYFQSVPSYQDLFGRLYYVECPECASVLSPAAYFLDLMRIADFYVGEPNQGTIPPGWQLAERRPDLFYTLELDCENGTATQPILVIVNEVLEARLALELGENPYLAFAAARYPFNQPYSLPLERIRAALPHLRSTLARVWADFGAPADAVARESLRVSLEQKEDLVTPHDTPESLSPFYGWDDLAARLDELARVEVFLERTGLVRPQLVSLLYQDLDAQEFPTVAPTLFINDTGPDAPPPLQLAFDDADPAAPVETIANLTIPRLDRLMRFIRLQAHPGWSYAALDWAMRSVADPAASGDQIAQVFDALALIEHLRTRLRLEPDVLAGFWYPLKTIGRVSAEHPQDLFDRTFNAPVLLDGRDPYTPPEPIPFDPARPLDWLPQGTSRQDLEVRSRLTAALGVTDNELTLAVDYLRCLLGLRQDAPLPTTLDNLSGLFRLTRLPAALGLGVEAYLILLRVMYGPDEACVDRPAGAARLTPLDVAAQAEVAAWMKLSRWDPFQLEYAITGRENRKVSAGYDPAQVGPFLDSLATASMGARLTPESFVFEDVDTDESARVFQGLVQPVGYLSPDGILRVAPTEMEWTAVAPVYPLGEASFVSDDITPQESADAFDLLVANGEIVPSAQDARVGALAPSFTAATDLSYLFPGDPDAQHQQNQVREVLLQVQRDVEHTLALLAETWELQGSAAVGGVAQFFGAESEMMAVLLPFAAPLAGVVEVLVALLTPVHSPEMDELFRLLARLLYVLDKLRYSAAEAAGAIADPAAFGLPDGDLDLAAMQSLWTFKALTLAFRDTDDQLLRYLESDAEEEVRLAMLSSLTGWPPEQLQTLVERFWPDSDASGTVAGVARLKVAFDRGAATGADVNTLLALEALSTLPLVVGGATDPAAWDAWQTAAGGVLDLVNARYAGTERDHVNASIQDAVATGKRDALLPYACWTLGLPDASALYEYLLIDVETSNCDRVSRIAQGISSVQLYLQRARLHLEPGVEAIPVPAVWWEWLSTYRIWEANRKLFLYPESYVDPSLRRSRTPIYTELQDALLQAEIDEASVAAAYRDYLDGFVSAAELRIAGVYRAPVTNPDTGETTDTLFQFGRTSAQPYVYYHRRLEHYAVEQDPATGRWRTLGTWSPWVKVGLTIAAERVTPVYAWERLMVFWAEQAETTGSYVDAGQESRDYVVVRASIRYSFLNFRGEWAPPQTLAGDIIVSVEPNSYPGSVGLDPALFDPRRLWWRQVTVLHARPGAYRGDGGAPFGGQEQLLVLYGPWLGFTPGASYTVKAPPMDAVSARYLLNREIHELQQERQKLAAAETIVGGQVPLKTTLAMAFTLIVDHVDPVFHDDLPAFVPFSFSGVLENRTLWVRRFPSQFAVQHGDQVVERPAPRTQPLALAAAGPAPPLAEAAEGQSVEVLVNLAAVNTAVTAVKNQPGWFVFDNGGDAFLAVMRLQPLRSITEIMTLELTRAKWPVGPLYVVSDPLYTTGKPKLEEQVFAFTRLGTQTVDTLSRLLFSGGIDRLLTVSAQESPELPFNRFYPDPAITPANVINTTTDKLDFDGAYGPYFWEVWFYTVFLVADRLNASRRFDQAKRWYEYVYDPMQPGAEAGSNDVYWRFLPFRSQTPEAMQASLTSVAQLDAYNNDPFDADAIARLRPGAYPRAMVIRYVQNLIDWGDALFTQDTRETITQATLLYVLAADLLGRPPVNLGTSRIQNPRTYAEIRDAYDTFGQVQGATATTLTLAQNASDRDGYYDGLTLQITSGTGGGQLRTIAAYAGATRTAVVPAPWNPVPNTGSTYQVLGIPQFLIEAESAPAARPNAAGVAPTDTPFVDGDLYFCVPENPELLALWQTVADRLFKIRHCMNIQGVERQLPQYEPPLDPRAVQAGAAAGGGVPPVQGAAEPAIPFYRFTVVLEQARSMAFSTAQLGSALLGALQALDGEELALLGTTQQQALLGLTTRIREDQVQAARWQLATLEEGRKSAALRYRFYSDLLARGLSPAELSNLASMEAALVYNVLASGTRMLASLGYTAPQVGSPFAITYGGKQLGAALSAASTVLEIGSTVSSYMGQRSLTMAGYERRAQEWELQQQLAELDVAAADDSLEAARLQLAIAERELEVHRRQVVQNAETEEFLRRKFTNRELYQWMSSRLSGLHFQAYSLAYGLALSAQRAYQYELDTREAFVNFGYWSAPQRGLLAGDGLLLSLNQMEAAYLAGTPRPLEIERTFSLLQHNPLALLRLREEGECAFELSERLFDQDFPGHYARKIKTLSVSIPAVVGPYQNVKATLTQASNQVVLTPSIDAVRYLLGLSPEAAPPAGQLRTDWWNRQGIALSTGVNDDGMFVLNFQDPRYLPFEGTGAVSTWRLSMPKAANRFDFEAISDVVVRVSYTAKDGGEAFRRQVTELEPVREYAAGRYLDLAQQYPDAWYAFLRDHTDPAVQTLPFGIAALAPPQVEAVETAAVFVQLQVAGDAPAPSESTPYLTLRTPGSDEVAVPIGAENSGLVPLETAEYAGEWTLAFALDQAPATLTGPDGFLDPARLLDVVLVVYYRGALSWGNADPAAAAGTTGRRRG
ncbi:MAG TPA: neuraminidase-like domain-containing protein [Longimicrobium sp.]